MASIRGGATALKKVDRGALEAEKKEKKPEGLMGNLMDLLSRCPSAAPLLLLLLFALPLAVCYLLFACCSLLSALCNFAKVCCSNPT